MATTFMKDTGVLHVLLVALFLPVVILAADPAPSATMSTSPTTIADTATTNTSAAATSADTATSNTSAAATSADTATTNTPATSAGTATTNTPATSAGTATTNTPATSAGTATTNTPATSAGTATTNTPATSATSAGTATTNTPATSAGTATSNTPATSAGTATSNTPAATATSGGPSSTTAMGASSSSMSSNSDSSTTVHIHNATMNMSSMNMTQIHCPSFTCNYSDCYAMYHSMNFTPCDAAAYCHLKKRMEVYTASCSYSCADNCTASMTNCSVTCCNFTGCLNGSFASMLMITTVIPTTKTTTTTTTKSPQTTANNGNKCYKGTCTDTDCYNSFKNTDPQICASTEKHCQLKKDTVDSKVQWTAGCTSNCSAQTPCKASTQPPCHLECCNATMTSCLWLNGTLNFPSSATRGPYLHTELITCLLCLFAVTLML